jgi:multisubunit Na+/H+ antiporter MnhG subunit
MGAGLVIVGLAAYNQGHVLVDHFGDGGPDDALLPGTLITVKLIMILVLLWLTSPTSTHAIAKAALLHGLEPRLAEEPGSDERRNSTDG